MNNKHIPFFVAKFVQEISIELYLVMLMQR